MTDLGRRRFVLAGSALAAAPFVRTRAHAAATTDVVIIGAGAAGIAAARVLREQGLSVIVIEASGRIGGRVHTDTSVFGVPYDTGAHWLHYREQNPFADYGEDNGFSVYRAPDDEILMVGDREADDDEYDAFDAAFDRAYRAIANAGRAGRDVAPADVVPDLGDWYHSAHLAVGPYEMAKDFGHFSCKDWWSGEDGTDYYCREGFGALFAHSAQDVPVRLNVTAKRVDWSGNGVEVATSEGTIAARAAVVTVSTGVLAGGAIEFEPHLPARTEQAVHQLTMGHYNRVALKFSRNFFGIGEDGYLYYKIEQELSESPSGFAGLIDASGTGVSYFDLGGEFARLMALEGDAAMHDFVVEELVAMFGTDVRNALAGANVSQWSTDPLTLGSYASAEPGGAGARDILRESVADRVWFAGEALSRDDWATVAGAHKSGIATARSLLNTVDV